MKRTFLNHFLAALFVAAPLQAMALTPFAGEDFDEGTIGGFTADTMVFTPDNSGSTALRSSFNDDSRFDRFGEISRVDGPGVYPDSNEGLPFGLRDDSVPGSDQFFEGDTAGFVAADKLDDFVVSVDTVNDQNPGGTVGAEWTFDITGRSNLVLSMDFGMLGDFEEDDTYEFTYSIDGAPAASAFSIVGASGVFYSYTMDNGDFVDRFESNFFSEDDWNVLTTIGEFPGDIEFHPADNGMDGDTTAQDGFIPVEFADGVEDVRAMLDQIPDGRRFEEQEFAPVQDPLTITSGDGTLVGEVIPADFTTFSTALEGTGTTLTLTLNGLSDGGDEWFTFDNIVLSEGDDTGIFGDFEPDGDVDIIDFGVFADAFGSVTGDAEYNAAADSEPDGDVDIIDFGLFADNFGTGVPATAVPEPTAALLAVLAMGAFAARRQG